MISEKIKAITGLMVCVLFWSINAAIARSFAMEIPPVILSIIRWAGAGLILLVLVRHKLPEVGRLITEHPFQVTVLALLSVSIYNTLQYKAGETTQSININLMITMCPPLTVILAFFINREKINFQGAVGLLLAVVGTLLVVSRGSLQNIIGLNFVEGDLIMLGAITAWGFYTVFLRRFGIRCSILVLLAPTVWIGLLALILFYVLFPVNDVYTFKGVHAAVYAYLWIFPSVLSTIFWMNGVKTLGPGKAALALYSAPVYGSIIGIALLGEHLSWFHVTGGLLILIGFYLGFKTAKKPQHKPA